MFEPHSVQNSGTEANTMASGDLLFELHAIGSMPPATAMATLDTIALSAGLLDVLDFAGATADESAYWKVNVPSHYAGGGFRFEIDYAMDGTDGSDVQFEISMGKTVATDALGSEGMGTLTDITDTPNGTANTMDTTPTGDVSHANGGSPAIGDLVRIKIARDFDHAANADDAQFITARCFEV